jgi:NAD(P)H-dependent FMN reductase
MRTSKMPHISIIPAIENSGKNNHHPAVTYIKNYLQEKQLASAEVLDPGVLQLPGLATKRKGRELKAMVKKIKSSSGIFIVTPEFNGEYPEPLKHMIDFLYDEWDHKPVAISTVQNDKRQHAQVIKSLQFSLWKVNSWTVPVSFAVSEHSVASHSTDLSIQSSQSQGAADPREMEFNQVLDNYCHKYIQLCTRIQYAV